MTFSIDQQPTIDVMTDSCSLSAGGYFRGDWFYFNFAIDNPSWSHLCINHKETIAIVLAAKHWAPQWANHCVIIQSDNQAAVFIINKGTTDNDLIMGKVLFTFRVLVIRSLMRYRDHTSPSTFIPFIPYYKNISHNSRRTTSHLLITCQFTVAILFFPGARDPRLATQLLQEIHSYRSQLFAETTKTTKKTYRDTYLRFCQYMGYCPVPVHPSHLLQYAAFLATKTLKASSVRSYLNIIGVLHKEFGFINPLLNNWPLKSLLTGINRSTGLTPNQKEPITPALL